MSDTAEIVVTELEEKVLGKGASIARHRFPKSKVGTAKEPNGVLWIFVQTEDGKQRAFKVDDIEAGQTIGLDTHEVQGVDRGKTAMKIVHPDS